MYFYINHESDTLTKVQFFLTLLGSAPSTQFTFHRQVTRCNSSVDIRPCHLHAPTIMSMCTHTHTRAREGSCHCLFDQGQDHLHSFPALLNC